MWCRDTRRGADATSFARDRVGLRCDAPTLPPLPAAHSAPRDPARPTTPTQLLSLASLLGRGEHDLEVEVRCDSMSPTFLPGDRARLRTGRNGPRSKGTVIAYVDGAGVVPHRIVRCGVGPFARRYVVTRGDGCLLCDPPLALESVVGTVVAREDEGDWLPVPPPPERSTMRRFLHAITAMPVVVALELHPRLARTAAHALLGSGRVVAALVRRPMHRW